MIELFSSGKEGLRAPQGYWNLSQKEKEKICNGAGPKKWGWLVPDTIWGLKITEPSDIHDYMYSIGQNIEDKDQADRVYLNNMLRYIQYYTKWTWLKKIRLMRAKKYYNAVVLLGGPAFWHGKDKIISNC